MGEDTKKTEDHQLEEKKEKEKASEEGKQDNKAGEDKKNKAEKEEESKDETDKEIVLKVYMHCEGCARKVRRSLKGFDGVEEVVTDCRTNRVVVKGEKVDPVKVLERVQRKSHRQVELLSPIPKPPPPPPPPPQEEKKPHTPEQPNNPPEKKDEEKVVTVVLKVHMNCEACAQEIKKRILRMKGVESVEPDLKGWQVRVRGVFEPAKLVEYVYKRTGKHAAIVKQEEIKKEEEEKEKEKKGGDEEEKKENKKGEEGAKEKEKEKEKEKQQPESATGEEEVDITGVMELKKSESLSSYYYPPYYPPRFVPVEYQYQYQYLLPMATAYPPQMFSDENPNACSVM